MEAMTFEKWLQEYSITHGHGTFDDDLRMKDCWQAAQAEKGEAMTFWELLESPQVKMELATPHTPSYWIQMGYRYGHNEGLSAERKRCLDEVVVLLRKLKENPILVDDGCNWCAALDYAIRHIRHDAKVAKAIEDKDGT